MSIPSELRKGIVRHASNRCEYCRLSQKGQEATFHIDHIVPFAAGGETHLSNLALACVSCSLRKGARRTGIDPKTGEEVNLFHPRSQEWNRHFIWKGSRIRGLTATGRVTVATLKMNRELAVAIRDEEKVHGRHPPV